MQKFLLILTIGLLTQLRLYCQPSSFVSYPVTPKVGWDATSYESWRYTGNNMWFRMKKPVGYTQGSSEKYPLLIFFHGAGEKGDDNENQLKHGGQLHRDAVDNGDFNGFLLYPQLPDTDPNINWSEGWLRRVREIMIVMISYYNVDPEKIVITGLSNGGNGVWQFLTYYPMLVSAAVPISDQIIDTGNPVTLDKLIHVPLWHGQGGSDGVSSSLAVRAVLKIDDIRNAGGYIRAVYFPGLGHGVWNQTWEKPEYIPFMAFGDKTNIVVSNSLYPDYTTTNAPTTEHFCNEQNINVNLGVTDGYAAYQWMKDGVVISGANDNDLQVTEPGSYQVRFQWPSSMTDPTNGATFSVPGYGGSWTDWSEPVVIDKNREKTQQSSITSNSRSVNLPALDGSSSVSLHAPASFYEYDWYQDGGEIPGTDDSIYVASDAGGYQNSVRDAPEPEYFLDTQSNWDPDIPGNEENYYPVEYRAKSIGCTSDPSNTIVVTIEDGPGRPLTPKNFFAIPLPDGGIQLTWDDQADNELNYELYRTETSGQFYELVAMFDPKDQSNNPQTYIDGGLVENTTFYYRLRAVNSFGGSDYTPEISATTFIDNEAPSIPILKVGQATATTIQLLWDPSDDNVAVTGYDIYKNGSFLITSPTPNYVVQGLTPNDSYTFYIIAKDEAGNLSNASNLVTAIAAEGLLDYDYYHVARGITSVDQITSGSYRYSGTTPNFDISLSDRSYRFGFVFNGYIRIQETGYYQFYTESDDGSTLNIDGGTIEVDNDGLHGSREVASSPIYLNEGIHSIEVLFFESGGSEFLAVRWSGPGFSKELIPDEAFASGLPLPAGPNEPTNLVANPVSYDQINLSWTDNSSDETGFEIHRSQSPTGPFNLIYTTSANITAYQDQGLQGNQQYYYKIRAINTINSSNFTSVENATTLSPPAVPTAPSSLVASLVGSSTAHLTWQDNSGNETGFEIQRTTNPAGGWYFLASLPANSQTYDDLELSGNATFYYRVRAIGEGGTSSFSNEGSVSTPNNAPVFATLLDRSVKKGTTLSVNVIATDADGDILSFSISGLPSFGQFTDNNDNSATIEFSPLASEPDATYDMIISADDGTDQTDENFTLTVSDNDNPYFDPLLTQEIEEGRLLSFNIQAHDAQGDAALSLSAQNFPSFALFADNGNGAGTITLDTHIGDVGSYNLKVVADDGEGGIQIGTFKVLVQKANTAQTIQVNFDNKNYTPKDPNWNNIYYDNQLPPYQSSLFNESGDPSGVILEWTDFDGQGKLNNFSGSGVYPTSVLVTNWEAGASPGKDMVFSGLNRSLKYAFYVLGNSGSVDKSMRYTLGSQQITINTQNNGSNLAVFDPVSPDQNGEVTLNVSKMSGTGPGPINAVVIEVFYDDGLPPTAPEITGAQALPGNQVQITWNDNSSTESGFRVMRSTSASGPFDLVADLAKNTTSFTDTDGNLEGHTAYYYRLDAYNTSGTGSSLLAAVTTLNNDPVIVSPPSIAVTAYAINSVIVTSTDDDNDQVTFSGQNIPSFASLMDNGDGTATITFNPTSSDIGNYNNIQVIAQDGYGGNVTTSFILYVISGQYKNSVYVNFAAANHGVGTPWNTQTNFGNGTIVSNLLDIEGNNSGLGLSIGSGWATSSNDGVSTEMNSGVLEDAVISSYWQANTSGALNITNLDLNSHYNISVFASVPALNTSASFTVQGNTKNLGISQNRDTLLSFTGIQPDGSGIVSINTSNLSGPGGTVINAILINTMKEGYLATPTNLVATAQSKTTILLTWDEEAYNESGYQIFRKQLPDGTSQLIQTTGSNVNSFSDIGLSTNTSYSYRVRAIGPDGYSEYSNEAIAATVQFEVDINFNALGTANAPAPWNNLQANADQGATFLVEDLVDTDGLTTTMDITMLLKTAGGTNNTGYQTGDDSGVYPDVVASTYYYAEAGPDEYELRDLDAGYVYNLTFFGSEDGTYAHPVTDPEDRAILKVVINGEDKYLDCYQNASNTISFDNINPVLIETDDYSGYGIHFTILQSDKYTIARWGMINAMVVQATQPVNNGAASSFNYYAMAGTDLSNSNNWNSKIDGTGTQPSGFTEPGVNFVIQNNTTGDINSTLNISGTGSRLMIDGNNTISVGPSVASLSFTGIQINPGSQIQFSGNTNPIDINIGSDGIVLEENSKLNVNDNNLILNGTSSININGQTGSLAIQGGSITINSSNPVGSNLYFDTSNNTVNDLTLNADQGSATYLMNELNVRNIVKLSSGEFNTTSGNLVLMSYPGGTAADGTGTARLAKVENAAAFAGELTMQRYWERNRYGYYYIGTPIQNQTLTDWFNEFWIQGTTTQYPGAWTNVNAFSESTGHWSGVDTDNFTIDVGTGVAAFMPSSDFADGFIRYDNTGQPVIGDFHFNLAYSGSSFGWNLVSNPYPSDIDWTYVADNLLGDPSYATNVDNAIYIWDGYNNRYMSWVNGVGDADPQIASGQAFFIRANGSNPELTVTEDIKIDQQATFLRKSKPVALEMSLINGEGKTDKAYISFVKEASNHFDPKYDAYKLKGSEINVATVDSEANELSINSLPLNDGVYDIPVKISVNKGGTHTFAFKGVDDIKNLNLFLIDNGKDIYKKIDESFLYSFDIPSGTGKIEIEDRFIIVSKPSVVVKINDKNGVIGSKVTIPVTVENFDDIIGAQFDITWDTTALQYIGVENFNLPALTRSNFGVQNARNGSLPFVWESQDVTSVSLVNETTIFDLKFKIKDKKGLPSTISISNENLEVEFYDQYLNRLNFKTVNGNVTGKHLYTLKGRVKDLKGNPIENAEIALTSDSVTTQYSKKDGTYSMNIIEDENLKMRVTKKTDSKNSVSVLDLLLVKRKLLGIRDFDLPLQFMAADVNNSGTLDVLDLALIRGIILGNKLPDDVSKSMKFILARNESSNIDYFDNNTSFRFNKNTNTVDIIGAYPGDVDTNLNSARRLDGNEVKFSFEMNDMTSAFMDEIEIPILANNFHGISGYQFSVDWDNSLLEFQGVINYDLDNQYNESQVDDGKIAVMWSDDYNGEIDIPDGDIIIGLKFRVIGKKFETARLEINSSLIPGTVVTNDLTEYKLKETTSSIFIDDPYRQNYLLGCYPNPFNDETTLRFVLSQKQMVGFEIVNSLGQIIDQGQQEFDKGLNEWLWNPIKKSNTLLRPGVYYIHLHGTSIFDTIRVLKN